MGKSEPLAPCLAALAALLLVGCGAGSAALASSGGSTGNGAPPAIAFSGNVNGGGPQNPIAGSTVTLYAMGPAGAAGGICNGSPCYGANALALAQTTSNSSGSFSFAAGSYNCSSLNDPADQTYITAIGGNPGSGENTAIGLIALTGPCNLLSSSTFVVVNELTTVAAEWAFTQFTDASGKNLGAASGDQTGLNNAYAIFGNLVAMDYSTDSVNGNPSSFLPTASQCSSASPPANCEALQKLDTLANILAACVNSNGPSSGACLNLFADTSISPSSTTLSAAHVIAAQPATNVTTLFSLLAAASTTPFEPGLQSAPNDWTLALAYPGGGLNGPAAIAIDAAGNAWVANDAGVVVELAPNGSALSGPAGFTGGGLDHCFAIAVDASGNVWVTDKYSSTTNGGVTELSASGAILSGPNGYANGGIDYPLSVVIDSSGDLWVANYANASLTENPQSSSATSITGGGLSFPVSISLDALGHVWAANFGNSSVSEFDSSGGALSSSTGHTSGGVDGPDAIALDPSGYAWIANYYGNSVTLLDASGDAASGSPFTSGGMVGPAGIALDGAGNVWISNYVGNSITELEGSAESNPGAPLSGSPGYKAELSQPDGLAIDSSGNVWVPNYGDNSVTLFLGAAAPVKTPVFGPPTKP